MVATAAHHLAAVAAVIAVNLVIAVIVVIVTLATTVAKGFCCFIITGCKKVSSRKRGVFFIL